MDSCEKTVEGSQRKVVEDERTVEGSERTVEDSRSWEKAVKMMLAAWWKSVTASKRTVGGRWKYI